MHKKVAMSLSHLVDNNFYLAKEKRQEKVFQNTSIQAVVRNQLSVLPSMSTVGNLADDPLGVGEMKKEKLVLKRQSIYSPG